MFFNFYFYSPAELTKEMKLLRAGIVEIEKVIYLSIQFKLLEITKRFLPCFFPLVIFYYTIKVYI